MLIKAILKENEEQMIGQLDFLLHNQKKNCIKLPSIGENVIEPQSNLSERPNITDFSAISFQNKQNSFLYSYCGYVLSSIFLSILIPTHKL